MATRAPSRIVARGLFSTVVLAAACNQIFDIQEAHVDPALASNGGVAQGGSTAGASQGGGVGITSGGVPAAGAGGKSSLGGALGMSGEAGMSGAGGASDGGRPTASGGTTTMGHGGSTTSIEGGAGGSGGTTGTPDLCIDYCKSITTYCTGDNLQYKDLEQCLKVCEYFPQGAVGDADADTVACRLKYSGKARYAGGTELAAYCRQGGPGGDGRCGSNCEGFCDITQATCNADDTAPYFYPSRQACVNSCSGLPDIPFVYGSKESADGNSVQCRLFHVMSAAMADAGEHCAHVLGITLCEPPN